MLVHGRAPEFRESRQSESTGRVGCLGTCWVLLTDGVGEYEKSRLMPHIHRNNRLRSRGMLMDDAREVIGLGRVHDSYTSDSDTRRADVDTMTKLIHFLWRV